MKIPSLTAEQMREVDRLMVDAYRIDLLQMMENAGRQLAELARERFLDGDPRGRPVLVLAGSGGNGGGGLAAARFLSMWGAAVQVVLSRPSGKLRGVPARQAEILKQLPIPMGSPDQLHAMDGQDLILDAVIGYSLKGKPHGSPAEMIRWTAGRSEPILSLDLPSGVDPDLGVRWDPHIRADATLTLALPKQGLMRHGGPDAAGELHLADIGVPPELYRQLGLEVGPVFAREGRLNLAEHQVQ